MVSKLLGLCELLSSYLLGKGAGAGTVRKELSAVLRVSEQRDVRIFVDVGGNKGVYTEQVVARFPDCKVVIFEPAEVNVCTLREKFSDNPNVTIEQAALSNITGESFLYSDCEGSGLASLTKRRLDHFGIEFSTAESVKRIKFEDYWEKHLDSAKIDICKIDIEGHELDCLSGFGRAIDFIDVIQFEFGGCNIDTRTFFQDFWYFFKERGFSLYRIAPIGVIKIHQYREIDESFRTTNYIAKRNHDDLARSYDVDG